MNTLNALLRMAIAWMFARTHFPRDLFGGVLVSKKYLYLPVPQDKDRDENDHSISSSSQKQ